MASKQLNRYADLVAVCRGDQRYGSELTFGENVSASVLAGELKVMQADRTVCCAAGDTAMASLASYADLTNTQLAYRLPVYQASKAALNMYTINLAYELRDTPFKINAVCPGYTQTDFTGHQGSSTAAEAGQRIVKYALLGPAGPTGQYFSEEYFPAPATCPW